MAHLTTETPNASKDARGKLDKLRNRLAALRNKHRDHDDAILLMERHKGSNPKAIQEAKKEKLRIADEIRELECQLKDL